MQYLYLLPSMPIISLSEHDSNCATHVDLRFGGGGNKRYPKIELSHGNNVRAVLQRV